jgi:hypothetical protein
MNKKMPEEIQELAKSQKPRTNNFVPVVKPKQISLHRNYPTRRPFQKSVEDERPTAIIWKKK